MNTLAEKLSLCLQTQEVRDLAWACFAPPLLHTGQLGCPAPVGNCALTLTPARHEWLQTLDRSPKKLMEHLNAGHSSRLGIYFESLWHFFLQQDPQVELIAHNLPVRDSNHTIGEFDCIYYCHARKRPVHLELAVKFYLAFAQTAAAEADWLGPNARDRLDLKLQRMLSHQILLSRNPHGAEVLAAVGVASPLLEVEIKGRLYRHVCTDGKLPAGYNLAQPLHDWCRRGELGSVSECDHARYLPLRREQWLAPVDTSNAPDLIDSHSLHTLLATERPSGASQFAMIDTDGKEYKRVFVVADTWPRI